MRAVVVDVVGQVVVDKADLHAVLYRGFTGQAGFGVALTGLADQAAAGAAHALAHAADIGGEWRIAFQAGVQDGVAGVASTTLPSMLMRMVSLMGFPQAVIAPFGGLVCCQWPGR
jgi:hypothetical protein